MRKFLAHTDLTNPQKYNDMMNQNRYMTVEKAQELNQTFGCVWKSIDSFWKVNLTLTGTFELEDNYGFVIYIAKEKQKELVFDMVNSNDFQLCDSLQEFDNVIRTTFKRKLRTWN